MYSAKCIKMPNPPIKPQIEFQKSSEYFKTIWARLDRRGHKSKTKLGIPKTHNHSCH